MNWDQIKENWKLWQRSLLRQQFKGKVKEKLGRLTDDDLDVIQGRRDQLVGKLQERYGRNKEQAEREIDEWFRRLS